MSDYKLRHYPYEDLIIYEMGAGNGTLMACILNFIRKEHPDVYERTRCVAPCSHGFTQAIF